MIIGKLIPAGTGFIHGRFTEEAEEALDDVDTAEELPDAEAGDWSPAKVVVHKGDFQKSPLSFIIFIVILVLGRE